MPIEESNKKRKMVFEFDINSDSSETTDLLVKISYLFSVYNIYYLYYVFPFLFFLSFFFFLWDWGLNSGFCAYKASTLFLEPCCQSVLL
jgi:hypothetical protein